MTYIKTEYQRNPKVLLAWGLGPDFNSGCGIATRWVFWMKHIVKALGFASIVLLTAF
ncbi:MAG: hypothetical protein IH611_04795 [Deltaproteobacteria bacterium]|nr:hypothetical protein [Deltaproteobacteria bacterium]